MAIGQTNVSMDDILYEKVGNPSKTPPLLNRKNISLYGLSVNGVADYQDASTSVGIDITGSPNQTAPYGMGEFRGWASQMPYQSNIDYGTVATYEGSFYDVQSNFSYIPFGVATTEFQIVQRTIGVFGTSNYGVYWYLEESSSANAGIVRTSINNGTTMNTGTLYLLCATTFTPSEYPDSYYIDASRSATVSNSSDSSTTTTYAAGAGEPYTSGSNWDSAVKTLLTPSSSPFSYTAFKVQDSVSLTDFGFTVAETNHTFDLYFRKSGYPDWKAHTFKVQQETDYTLNEQQEGCPFCCVHDSMLIATGDDMRSIYDIKIGDMVVSHNFETRQDELTEVTDLIIVDRDVDYKVNDLVMTEDHPVYLEGGRKASVNPNATLLNYKQEVDQLVVGDKMMKLDGSLEEITSIEKFEGEHKNFAVQTKYNNFYANGHLVDSVINRETNQ